ncbi:AraC family transcriptional regulator [Catenovulum sp. 2E275]|uniref:AraC family transcriptional regulator n=1 Tax=Catenovulum sp. 2E275 TaxID=2980497 RepID=UPI0021D2CBE5|nr:AraC family transcriptional regulator [Catenovulum sp. 2E275]MCU4675949.1 AraC family transcriptional regulator [Catenovulum sp. 2E275]
MKNFIEIDDKILSCQSLPASMIDLAMARGVNPQKLVRGTGIFYEDIQSNQHLLSPAQVIKLVERAKQFIPGYDASFLLGQRLILSQLGALSQALSHAKNITDFLRIAALFQHNFNPFIQTRLYRQDGYLKIQFYDAIGCAEQYTFLLEVLLTAIHSSIKYLTKQRIPLSYQFSQKRPRYIQEYEENLGFRVEFEQPVDQLAIKLSDLNTAFVNYSPLIRAQALYKLKQDLTQTPRKPTFIQAVLALQNMQQSVNQEAAAQQLGLSTATFKRKLKQHNTRYLALQDDYFKQNAVRFIKDSNCTNEHLANQLGFSDIANFRRAFKRWFNMTPSEFKAKYYPLV